MAQQPILHYKLPHRASMILKTAIIGSLVLFPAHAAGKSKQIRTPVIAEKISKEKKPIESPAFRALSGLIFCTSEANVQKLVSAFPRNREDSLLLKKEMEYYPGFPYLDGFTSSPEIMARHVADVVTRLKNGEAIPTEYVPRDSTHAYYKGPDRDFLAIMKAMNQMRLFGRLLSAADRDEINAKVKEQFNLPKNVDVVKSIADSRDYRVELANKLKVEIPTAQAILKSATHAIQNKNPCE